MANDELHFADLTAVVTHIRSLEKKHVLLYAYNGTGKTRLSMAFKDAGKAAGAADTLYYNAFTEDLFSWDNDLENDTERKLVINSDSQFFNGLKDLEMDNRIRPVLQRYADFDFVIDYDAWTVRFFRNIRVNDVTTTSDFIKISRGEENIFIWCFFLAVAQLAIDEQEGYKWVKYIYIDDPISSLDDNNAVAVAGHLAKLLKRENNKIKAIISSHHTLFFNVMHGELKTAEKYFLSKKTADGGYSLTETTRTPFFHHVSLIRDLHQAVESGKLYTYHFNILRNVLEKTAAFHGFNHFSSCIKKGEDDPDGALHARIITILNHGEYSLFEPVVMLEENKEYFKRILTDFMNNYRFNEDLLSGPVKEDNQS